MTETRTATRIVDRRQEQEVEKLGPGAWLVDGELVAATERHADTDWTTGVRPAGPWQHGPRGRVLSVR
jgi:hypothetical protein